MKEIYAVWRDEVLKPTPSFYIERCKIGLKNIILHEIDVICRSGMERDYTSLEFTDWYKLWREYYTALSLSKQVIDAFFEDEKLQDYLYQTAKNSWVVLNMNEKGVQMEFDYDQAYEYYYEAQTEAMIEEYINSHGG